MRLQSRILGYVAFAALASCVLTVAVAVVLVRHRVSVQRLDVLQAQAGILAATGGARGALSPGQHVYRLGDRHVVRLGPLRSAAVLRAIPAGDAEGTTTIDGRAIVYAARDSADGRIVLVRSAGLAFAEWRPFLWSVVFAGLGGALLALLLSYALARRLARPIDALAAATRRLAAGETSVAVPVKGEDELAELAVSFNAMAGQLAGARAGQQAFLESVSHELKTPLTAIRGYGEALEEQAVSAAEAGRVIVAESGRLERLVSDLLELARVGRADFSVSRDRLDLGALAEEAVRRHAPRARELGVALHSAVPTDGGALAMGDHGRLLQAVSNLVENALRLTPADGEIVVAAAPGRLSVADTGPGLAGEDLPRAFERFYLHRRYGSERSVGSGLGLAIVRELVVAMGGSVEAAARPEGGALFTLHLPEPDPTAAATPARSAPPGAGRPSA